MARIMHDEAKAPGWDFYANNKRLEQIRDVEFSRLKGHTYLDHAGTTLYSERLISDHMTKLQTGLYGNPHSGTSGQNSASIVEQTRYRVLSWFNLSPDDYSVIFTSGATGALRIVGDCFEFDSENNGSHDTETIGAGGNMRGDNGKANSNQGLEDCLSFNELQHSAFDVNQGDSKDVPLGGVKDKSIPQGAFVYLEDNHTSVVGMRELFKKRGVLTKCLFVSEADKLAGGSGEKSFFSKVEVSSAEAPDTSRLDNRSSGPPSIPVLFAYPAQSNFSGRRYNSAWSSRIRKILSRRYGNVYILLDGASYVTSSRLDLRKSCPDFAAISFYKIFGYPTGLGALLVKNTSSHLLKKTYFGGGTVDVSIATEDFHAFRKDISERFEDGTISFLDIMALQHGFEAVERISGCPQIGSLHPFVLGKYLYEHLRERCHRNGRRVAMLYCDSQFVAMETQGPIVAFNLLRADGSFIGFSQIDKLAQACNIHVRVGCFCNLGACQNHLGLSAEKIKANFQAGHVCGDDLDLIEGQPTGAIRVSFGYMSTLQDAVDLINFIEECFVEGPRELKSCETVIKDDAILRDIVKEIHKVAATEPNDGIKRIPVDEVGGRGAENEVNASETQGSEGRGHGSRKVAAAAESESLASQPTSSARDANRMTSSHHASGSASEPQLNSRVVQDGKLNSHYLISGKGTPAWNPESASRSTEASAKVKGQGQKTVLRDIFLYPVKSCGGLRVDKWPIGPRGLLYDRMWMVVTSTGSPLTQKQQPDMCTIRPSIDLEKGILTLQYEGIDDISLPLEMSAEKEKELNLCHSKVCGDRIKVEDCGDDVASWLADALGRTDLRLVKQPSASDRKGKRQNTDGSTSQTISLVNEAQFLLINMASVTALQQKSLQNNQDVEEDLDTALMRFRANLVVEGGWTEFQEDTVWSLQIGKDHFVSQGGCARCQMICVDQQTGERNSQTLKSLILFKEKKMKFGILLQHSSTSESVLCCGDEISITKEISPENKVEDRPR